MTSHAAPGSFQCPEPGCESSYKRKEYLVRHMAKHQGKQHLCPHCNGPFGRKDTLRRHIQIHHQGASVDRVRAPVACIRCKSRKTRCGGSLPCNFCLERGLQCEYENPDAAVVGEEDETRRPVTDSCSSDSQLSGHLTPHIDVYFRHFHPTWPFIHKATFHPEREFPMLVQAVLMVGLWTSGGQNEQQAAVDIYQKLMSCIREQREKWDVSYLGIVDETSAWPMATYQGILLTLIFGTMAESQGPGHQLSASNLDVLTALVKSCLKRGMFNYRRMQMQHGKLDPNCAELYIWVALGEGKRFALALYKLWNMYRDAGLLPDATLLTTADLQFHAPIGEHAWAADTEVEFVRRLRAEKLSPDCENESLWLCNLLEPL